MLRIGIDVGGTHTDAVLMDGDDVLAWTKVLTSADVQSGIMEALERLLTERPGLETEVQAVMLGTTQFTNAVVQRRDLAPVAAVRIGLPSGQGLPPKSGWPRDIDRALGDHVYLAQGGYLYDGWPLAPADDAELDRIIADIAARDVEAVAVASAFAPAEPGPENAFAERLHAALPQVRITLSHQVGGLGLLERENAAILNASLLPFAERVVNAFVEAVRARGLTGRFFVSQNDGTLMSASFARRFPALTFSSGPTNSIRGACRLTGLDDAVVVDIGGTTSDIGILQSGFPRESNVVIEVGGVRTNFRMPDVLALGLGGGSVVREAGALVGPESVGHRLVSEALVFGGATLTATDVVVAAGHARIGDPAAVATLDASLLQTARATMQSMLNRAIDSMKPNSDPLPVVLVGGGAVLLTEPLAVASATHTPELSAVANAIGAAIAQIGGEAEQICAYESVGRDAALQEVTQAACAEAVAAGAEAASLRTVDIEETPLSYMAGRATRLRVKVVGDIAGIAP